MHTPSDKDRESRRLIVFRFLNGTRPGVLLGFERSRHVLPQVEITCTERIAVQLTDFLKAAYGIDGISLDALESPRWKDDGTEGYYEILESVKCRFEAPWGTAWVAIDSLGADSFCDPLDFQAIQQAVTFTRSSANPSGKTFAKLGWFHDLQQWIQQELGAEGLRLNGRYRQFNAGSTFCLVRFETDGTAVWFKAVGAPNTREYSVTLALARSQSRFLPEVIATRQECNGWLTREAEGTLLSECVSISQWERVTSDLAQLQIGSLHNRQEFLEAGARDLRIPALANIVEPFFQVIEELMERQTATSPARLSREQLHSLSLRVEDALGVLEKKGLPETIGHMDINPGNIIHSSSGSVFLDWAEAFVGSPLLTFEYLREHFCRTFGQDFSSEPPLVAMYLGRWRNFASEGDIWDALEAMRLVAVFAYATGNDRWMNPQKIETPSIAGYLRSLARRMEIEARRLAERRFYGPACRPATSFTD